MLLRFLMADADAAGGAGAAVADAPQAAPASDPAPASSAASATSLDDLPFPDVSGIGGSQSDAEPEGEPAGEGESTAEGGGGEGAPAAEGEADALPWDNEETLGAFLDVYGEKLLTHPKGQEFVSRTVQSQVDRELAKRAELPETDQRYIEQTTAEDRALGELAAELRKFDEGEAVDTRKIAAATLAVREANQRKESIAHQRAADAVVGQVTTELNQQAGRDLFGKDARSSYDEATQLYNRMVGAPDERTRQRAFPEYLRRTLAIVRDAAVEHGRSLERTKLNGQQKARETLQQENARRQVLAQAAKGARPTPAQPGAAPTKKVALTRETLSGSWQDDLKLMRERGERI